MLQETLDHLKRRDLLLGDRVNRDALSDLCLELLRQQPVDSTDMNEINEKALIVAEIRHEVLGDPRSEDVEHELDDIITQLVSADGKVQDKLENGFVLCAAQVERRLTHNGSGSITIRRRGRFITSNPDTTELFYFTPAANRLLSSMKSYNKRLELGSRRQPELASRGELLKAKAHEQIQLELPVEAQS